MIHVDRCIDVNVTNLYCEEFLSLDRPNNAVVQMAAEDYTLKLGKSLYTDLPQSQLTGVY